MKVGVCTVKHLYKATNRNCLSSYEKGVSAELCAKNYFVSRGYQILGCRVRNCYGEIDLIVKKNNDVVAVEVKQRKSIRASRESILVRQQARIARAFLMFMSERNEIFENYRIDVVCFDLFGRLEHIKNAFFIDEVA